MKPKKIMLTGVNGQVGHALMSALTDYNVVVFTRDTLNLEDAAQIQACVESESPDLIINPAAYTAVDKAESEEALAFAINAEAPKLLAQSARKAGAALIHFSTDYVYDGEKSAPYIESDRVNPKGVYGASKLAGEEAIIAQRIPYIILRTSWVYGAYGHNFLKTILRLATERDKLNVVADQFGAPTSSDSIAQAVCALVAVWQPEHAEQSGIYHMSNAGKTSWHGFAQAGVDLYHKTGKLPALNLCAEDIQAIPASAYPTPAARPSNSCLSNEKLKQTFDVSLPAWEQGLALVMQNL